MSTVPLHVLVVEDDADTRSNLVDILELDHCVVETIATAAELLQPRDWSRVSAVILDRKLPDGTAEELLPFIRKSAPHADVVVATGYADLDGAILALRHGATDYLLKPIQVDMLRATIARVVQRRELTREKQRNERAFHAILETSPCLIAILRFDHRIVYLSPFGAELTGYSAREALGQDFCHLLMFAEEHAHIAEHVRLLHDGKPMRHYECRVRCRDGSTRTVVWNANRLEDYEGHAAVLAVGIDITERKQSEERALQAQRLAAIGETMTGLVHESRNALQRSTACLEMLELEVQDRPTALDLLSRIQRAQKDLQQLYEDVRQYAAPLPLERNRIDVARHWRKIWDDLAMSREEKRLHLVEDIVAVDLHCEIDSFALGQVWRNIFENAIQVSPPDGTITVRCSAVTHEGGPGLRIAIGDRGPGLSADQRRRIFEPFFTTKAKGTGLGMAIAQRIVHAHGGTIETGTSASGGAELIVTLPRAAN